MYLGQVEDGQSDADIANLIYESVQSHPTPRTHFPIQGFEQSL
jgi:hypothetical protein